MSNQGNLSRRLGLFAFLLVALVGALGIRLVDFQVVRADEISKQSLESRSVTQTLTALRGEIRDASGQVMARTVFRYDVNAAPKNVGPVKTFVEGVRIERSVQDVSLELATLLGLSLAELASKLEGNSEYSNLAKKVDAQTYNAIRDLEIPWIYFDKFADRLYPDGAVAGNLIGFVGSDGTPLAGLERQYNSCLAGIDGQETFERSREGVRIPTSNQTTQPTQHGGTLNLSIDANLQFFAQQVLANAVSKLSAEWATAIVIEVETGRILAAAEAPSVDPNDPGATSSLDRGSRIFQAAFEPGSIMKAITSAIVLDTGKASERDTVIAPDYLDLDFPGGWIKDSFSHEDFTLTLAGVLRYSSNTGMSKFGIKVDSQTRYDYLKRFGFGATTPLRFEGESSGILHPAKEWDKMTNYATLYGQGISVTTIQMASAYQAIANDGVRLSPVLVDSCVKEDGTLYAATPQQSTRVIKKSTANLNLELMEKVVEFGGVGKNAQIDGYRVAGKTGTAQIQDGLGGYGERYAISFYGVAPVEDPKFVVGISIFRPLGETNSLQATPPFVAIMQQALKQYRIPPSTTSSRDIPSDKTGK
ncbi:penicillin-binding protein 2 [Candidatus Aquiluna sp. UB-MaderosW2red]|uniref:peptidoglycan D,D-transpeptidase FtsI family protein n=1 Tax=Candidatus Aquiluna sp. UB-MaderosW2red TaxID=1855377 RepID=UPI000875C7C9|nr:penicillin-binding protein 2 [Candidatus Aquiluna sp. UB-MaderosW2red]SCX12678.1 cell division protein FtsI (penicillin-binding protein 3) [Candidatus Aquiluna sp. UB-MaderosW2red]